MSAYLGFEPVKDGDYYFVSYNTEDAHLVGPVVQRLAEKNIPFWYDFGLEYGSQWEARIPEKIRNAKAVLLFFSKGILAKENSYVQKEYIIATQFYNKNVYVVMLDSVSNSDVPTGKMFWWVELQQKQNIVAANYRDKDALCGAIAKALGADWSSDTVLKHRLGSLKKYDMMDVADGIRFHTHKELLDECFGRHGNLMRAVQDVNAKCRVWMPKFITDRYGNPKAVSSGWKNEINAAGDTIVTTAPRPDPANVHFPSDYITLVFAMGGRENDYTFRGAFVEDRKESTDTKFCLKRIAKKVRFVGDPVHKVELLDEDRSGLSGGGQNSNDSMQIARLLLDCLNSELTGTAFTVEPGSEAKWQQGTGTAIYIRYPERHCICGIEYQKRKDAFKMWFPDHIEWERETPYPVAMWADNGPAYSGCGFYRETMQKCVEEVQAFLREYYAEQL